MFSFLKKALPFLVLIFTVTILGKALFYNKPHEIPSPLIAQPIPTFSLATVANSQRYLSNSEFKGAAKIKLLTFWATWCDACLAEHAMLLKISTQYHIPIYGILYKDDAQEAMNYLLKEGNPFVKVGNDTQGNVAIDFGVYGTPETFFIANNGKIIYRHLGIIDNKNWQNKLLPIINKYNQ